jgi:hypothetical protein
MNTDLESLEMTREDEYKNEKDLNEKDLNEKDWHESSASNPASATVTSRKEFRLTNKTNKNEKNMPDTLENNTPSNTLGFIKRTFELENLKKSDSMKEARSSQEYEIETQVINSV